MGSEEEKDSSFTAKLPLLAAAGSQWAWAERSLSGSWMLTPPHHALASVPFRWEEQPGKPKPCTRSQLNDFVPNCKCLELPPARLLADADRPDMGMGMGRGRGQSSSFRMGIGTVSECYGSFRATSPEPSSLGALVVSQRGYKEKGFLASWKRRAFKTRREVGGNSCVFPSNSNSNSNSGEYTTELGEENTVTARITRIKRAGSFSTLAHSKPHFWASIYQGLKQVVPVPWSKREKNNGFTD